MFGIPLILTVFIPTMPEALVHEPDYQDKVQFVPSLAYPNMHMCCSASTCVDNLGSLPIRLSRLPINHLIDMQLSSKEH